MREIKFRAWDKEDEKIIDSKNIFLHDGKPVAFRVNKPEKVRVKEYPSLKETVVDVTDFVKNLKISHENLVYIDDFEIMQFTGLKDKNGKEIYEGDIVKYASKYLRSSDKDFFDKCLIVFLHGAFYLEVKGNHFHIGLSDKMGQFEVIGNKFENPELLK